MQQKRILVSGASIAGPTAAYWLHRYGFEVVVVEKADALRLGGQNIDVKGPAREVVAKMGLEEKVRQANTTEIGLRFVDSDNRTLAEFPKDEAFSMTQELEILRGDLVELLYEATKKSVEYRFGVNIETIAEEPDGVQVGFSDGTREAFDLIIIAEGIGSASRELVFPGETDFRYLGVYCAYFSAKKTKDDSTWARWHNAITGIVYLLRPDNKGGTRACVNFRSPEKGYEKLSDKEKKELVVSRISGTGWESPRLAEAVSKADDLYLERLSQVRLKKWSKGRVCLLGDAAYCVTPIGGGGTDLAIAGAYILAGELHANADSETAFKAYEAKLRPLVDKIQQLPPGVPRLVYPTSAVGVGILNTLFRVAGSRLAKKVFGVFGGKKEVGGFVLPEY